MFYALLALIPCLLFPVFHFPVLFFLVFRFPVSLFTFQSLQFRLFPFGLLFLVCSLPAFLCYFTPLSLHPCLPLSCLLSSPSTHGPTAGRQPKSGWVSTAWSESVSWLLRTFTRLVVLSCAYAVLAGPTKCLVFPFALFPSFLSRLSYFDLMKIMCLSN